MTNFRPQSRPNFLKYLLPVMWVGAALRIQAARATDDPAVRDIAVALTSTALGTTLLPPSALTASNRLLGDPNFARFASQVCTVVAGVAGNSVLMRSAYPDADRLVRRRRWHAAGALAAMTASFANDHAIAAELQVPTHRIYRPAAAAFWLPFSGFVALAAIDTARLARRTQDDTDVEGLRTGLRSVSAGAAVMGVFYVHQGLAIVGHLISARSPEPVRGVRAQAIIAASAATIAVGASLPGVLFRARTWTRTAEDVHLGNTLHPLWKAVGAGRPEVTLAVSLRHPELRLYRRVMEILDGIDRLATRCDPGASLRAQSELLGAQLDLNRDDITALTRAALVTYVAAAHGNEAEAPALSADSIDDAPLTGGNVDKDWRREASRLIRTVELLQTPLPQQVVSYARTVKEPHR